MNPPGGESTGKNLDIDGSGCWKSVRTETDDGVRVGGKAEERVQVRRSGIDNARVGGRWGRHHQRGEGDQPGVLLNIGGDGDLFLVVVEAVTATNDRAVVESRGTPGETDLRSEVAFLGSPRIAPENGQTRHISGSRAGIGHEHVVLFRIQRAEIGIAQAQIERQVRAVLEIVLNKQSPDILAIILALGCGQPAVRIEATVFLVGRVIQESPQVEEVVTGYAATDALVEVEKARKFSAKLQGVRSDDLGGNVFPCVGPLIQDAADTGPELVRGNAADRPDYGGGQPDRGLGIGCDFIPAPSCGIEAEFVQESSRDGVVPNAREGVVDLIMVEQIEGAIAVEVGSRQRDPIHRIGEAILRGDVGVNPAVVLRGGEGGGVRRQVVREIGRGAQPAADARIAGTHPGKVLRAEGRSQGGADIDPLTGNGDAVHALDKACRTAVAVGIDPVVDDAVPGETEVSGGDASRTRQGGEGRCFIPSVARDIAVRLADGLIVKEKEDFVFPDRPPDAAAELVELVVISQDGVAEAVVRLEGVQVWLVGDKEKAAVEVVGAALGGDFDVCPGKATILGIVAVGNNFYVLD